MSTVNTPACLHLPELREGRPARVRWGAVPGATAYELDCVWDSPFAPLGCTWRYVREEALGWSDLDDLDWRALQGMETAPLAPGEDWRGVHREASDWSALAGEDWQSLHGAAASLTVYRGPGLPAFDEGDCGESHLAWEVAVPCNRRAASFRVRALGSDGAGEARAAEEIPITPLFQRGGEVPVPHTVEDRLLVLHARDVDETAGAVLELRYAPHALSLLELSAQEGYGLPVGEPPSLPARALSLENGRVRFAIDRTRPGSITGPVAALRVRARQPGAAATLQ